MAGVQANQQQTECRGPILISVQEALCRVGFPYEQLQVDIPNTQNGPYSFESYLHGPTNLALLKLPPGVATEANLLLGPSDERRDSFSFKVYTLAGDGELLICKLGSYEVTVKPLYLGAAVIEVSPGEVYAYRAGPCGLTVLDYCDPAFQQGWEQAVSKQQPVAGYEGLCPPRYFWERLESEQGDSARALGDACEKG